MSNMQLKKYFAKTVHPCLVWQFTITFITLLFLLSPFSAVKKEYKQQAPAKENLFTHKPVDLSINQKGTPKSFSNQVDTAKLKQTGWYAAAMSSISESEYEIKFDAGSGTYASPNRSQNLRSFYSGKTFTLQPRKDSVDNWKLELLTKGVYAGNELVYLPNEQPLITQNGKSIQFNHQDNFITEYINNKEGIRQNFIIKKEPSIKSNTISVKLEVNEGWLVNKVHAKEIHFAKAVENGYSKKLTYNQLKVWDANNKELEASFSVDENIISINVNTNNAVYPVTIDPVSSTANALVSPGQANAQMGRFLSSAGDVNGDGYSDIIVGAALYDNGQTDEGAAFIYHGSATGISTTPAIILESNQAGASFGTGVSGAGDINGDGYSDIVVGALGCSLCVLRFCIRN
jgi:FG-GAP-like repeat